MSKYARAREHEEAGDLHEAARLFASQGFDSLIDADLEVDSSTARVAMGHLLEAVGCDSRAGNPRRAELLSGMLRELLRAGKASTDDPCLEGLFEEWLGDSLLMTGRDSATRHYEQARELFGQAGFQKRMSWGMEEAFDYGFWAFEGFAEARGFDVPSGLERGDRFDDRIAFKIDVARSILEDE